MIKFFVYLNDLQSGPDAVHFARDWDDMLLEVLAAPVTRSAHIALAHDRREIIAHFTGALVGGRGVLVL